MNKFGKNSILCGEVDYHCLLCEETMQHEADVERHIRWENHRKALKNNTYVPKFKNDFIIKIGSHYYCELCNVITPTALKTNLHVKDESHIRNKQHPEATNTTPSLVKRDTSGTIAINNMVVTEREWNGIIDNQCLLCDVDVDGVGAHMKSISHIISLIQTKVEVKDGDKLFRKIGGDIFFCFTCKEPIPLAIFDGHWASKEHIDNKKNVKLYSHGASSSNGQITFSAEFKNNMKKMFASSEPVRTNASNAEIAAKIEEFKKENIDINVNGSKAVCKVCNFSPEFTVKAITEHIKMHKKAETNSPGFQLDNSNHESEDDDDDDDDDDYEDCSTDSAESDDEEFNQALALTLMSVVAVDHGQRRAELAKFGKQHFIKLISGGSKGHCTLCDSYISAHMKNFHQHVKGAKHIENLAAKGINSGGGGDGKKDGTKEYETKPLREYLRNIFFVKQMDDFWINRRICIDKHSFVGVTHVKNNGKYDKIKCFLCNDVFPADKDQEHCQTIEHKKKLFATKVITSVKKGEFCRQFTPTKLHCGFCNEVYPSWQVLQSHLRTAEHINWKRQQKLVADMTDDMYSMHMPDTNTADTDIMWMELTGNKLL